MTPRKLLAIRVENRNLLTVEIEGRWCQWNKAGQSGNLFKLLRNVAFIEHKHYGPCLTADNAILIPIVREDRDKEITTKAFKLCQTKQQQGKLNSFHSIKKAHQKLKAGASIQTALC